jgi:hypothetical protein
VHGYGGEGIDVRRHVVLIFFGMGVASRGNVVEVTVVVPHFGQRGSTMYFSI